MQNTINNQSQKGGSFQQISQQLIAIQSKKDAGAYFYIILTFFAVSFFGFFVLRPAFSTITTLRKQLADSQTVYSALQAKVSALQSLSQQYIAIGPNLSLVYDAIPTTSEIPLFTRQIEVLAQENNLLLSSFSTSTIEYYPLSVQDKLYGYSFSLDVSGQKDDINIFLNKITNLSRIISIEKITTGKSENGLLNLSLSGKAYFQKCSPVKAVESSQC